MKREDLLEKGYTEEQVSELLDLFHKNSSNISKANQDLQAQLDNANNRIAGLSKLESEYNALKQSQLTEAEKQELARKETAKNLAESRRILNTAKAKEIFSEIGGIDDEVLKAIVSEDTDATLANANALLNSFKARETLTINKTKEEIASANVKPAQSNVLVGDADAMTWEKFDSMSSDEQVKFAEEHPNEFNNLK